MSTVGTFDSFTSARMGIYSAQHGLRVTGNNISNINTSGYTRQRVDQVSFKTGASDRYSSWMDNHVGNGSLVRSINQIRDPFLDIRYRTTATDTYYYDAKLSGLQNIASILDEVARGNNDGDGLIYAQLQDMLTQLRGFSANPTKDNDTLVRNSAESLASLFRYYAGKLDELYANTETDFYKNIDKVNEILVNIRDLDESIRDAEIHGDMALEMRDERNRQIDELSKYMSIRVEYSYEDVGAGVQVEKLTIRMGNSNPDKNVHTDESILVDGLYCTQLSVPEQKPVLNTYDNEYLQGYLYLRALTADAAKEATGLDVDELVPWLDEDGNPITDDQGNPLYLVGTNDAAAEGIVTEDNDNYTVQLGKLMDRKDNVWKSTETTWAAVAGSPSNAKFAYTIKNTSFVDGDTFGILGTTFTVGTDIPVEDANDPEKFAAFVAQQLAALDAGSNPQKYADYNISAEGDQIIFEAKNPGAIGSAGAPAEVPTLSVKDPDGTGRITLGARQTLDNGQQGDPDRSDEGTVTDEYGNTTTIKYVQSGDQWYKITIETEYAREIALDDNDLHGILQAQRELLTEEGEFASAKDVAIDEKACEKRGLPYYIKSLDLLAQKFAEAYNELNQGYMRNQDGYYVDKDGNLLMLEDISDLDDQGNPTLKPVSADGLTEGQLQNLTNNGYTLESWLEENGGVFMGGPLFSNSNAGNDTDNPPINAHNIDISAGWSNGAWGLVPKFEILFDGSTEHTTQNKNADHMVSLLMDKALTYDPRDLHGSDAIGPVLFEGTFNDMLSNMMGVEASDERMTSVNLTTSDIMLTELDYSREGVSGVDLNDEAMNMISYQKAMNAAMRLMTAIDEELDRLINNTGVAGR